MNDNVIKILIEGDASGLTSSLRSALNAVKKNVNQMNDQQVNWDSILAKTISPTIIGAVAATFATAVSQFVNFQSAATNLNNIGGAATTSFANSIGTAGGAAYTLAQGAGQSLGDTASAFNAFSKAGLQGAAATMAVSDASAIAYATGQNFGDVVSQLATLFNQWGVTTAPQVTEALTGLANAAKNGEFTFSELVDAITPQGQFLQTKTNISNIAINLATLSTQSGLSKTSILDTFNAIAGATGQTAIIMNAAFGGAAKAISTGPNGLITAFTDIKNSVDRQGTLIATSFGSQVGIMNADIMGFANTAKTGFSFAATAATTLHDNLVPLNTITNQNTTYAADLAKQWENFQTNLSSFVIPAALSTFKNILEGINTIMSGNVSWKDFFSAIPSGVAQVAQGAASAGFSAEVGVGSALQGLGQAFESMMTGFLGSVGINVKAGQSYAPASNAPTPTVKSQTINITQNISGNGGSSSPLIMAQSLPAALNSGFHGSLI